ncbi:MAG TPA: ATP-binding protein [Hyphomicrobiaceae bacterium]|nr:ATP-binding protein [Hyphomicrobiaceae bacterium]
MTVLHRFALKQPVASDVSRLNEWLDDVFKAAALNERLSADLKLCINEVIANLISYGFIDTLSPAVTIILDISQDSVRAVIEDNGCYFDMREWPSPERPKDLATARIGGFGIELVRERASELRYERDENKNRLTIVCLKHAG